MSSESVDTTTLAGGTRILTRRLPGTRSAAIGLWLYNGSRHCPREQAGYAHLLEHLVFKGCGALDAPALSAAFEAMGGQVNAQTGRELTAFHGLVPGEELPTLARLLVDMLLRPRFTEEDVALEREVVLQEIAMVSDFPEEALEDWATERVWPDQPLGWQILGYPQTLGTATAPRLHTFLQQMLGGTRIRVVAVGDVDHARLAEACAPLGALPAGAPPVQAPPAFAARRERQQRDLAQTHLQWLLPVAAIDQPSHEAQILGNYILGGGVASRLFQELRERQGLVYGIHSRLELYSDAGLCLVQTSCEPRAAAHCARVVESILEQFASSGPTDAELAHARRHMRARLLIETDDPEAHMERIARDSIYLGRALDVEERLARVDAVDAAAVRAVFADAWDRHARFDLGPG